MHRPLPSIAAEAAFQLARQQGRLEPIGSPRSRCGRSRQWYHAEHRATTLSALADHATMELGLGPDRDATGLGSRNLNRRRREPENPVRRRLGASQAGAGAPGQSGAASGSEASCHAKPVFKLLCQPTRTRAAPLRGSLQDWCQPGRGSRPRHRCDSEASGSKL